jgi:nitroreductase
MIIERKQESSMEKTAPIQFPVHDLIRQRWSPRAFAAQPVPPDVLQSLLEAARWAASSFNEQPWRYLIATQASPQEFNRILGCLVEKNQRWAKSAPVLMLSFFRKIFSANGHPNRVALHDVGAASAQMAMEATARGLFVHQMAGIEVEKIRETFKLPPEFEPAAAIAIGYPGDPQKLPDEFRAAESAPRTRKAFSELFFSGGWGNPAF